MTTATCVHCGAPVEDETFSCRHCGAVLGERVQPATAVQSPLESKRETPRGYPAEGKDTVQRAPSAQSDESTAPETESDARTETTVEVDVSVRPPGVARAFAPASHGHRAVALPRKTGSLAWLLTGLAVAASMLVLGILSYLYAPVPSHYCTSPCRRQTRPSAELQGVYTSTAGYSLRYDSDTQPSRRTGAEVGWSIGQDQMRFRGESAGTRSVQQIVQDVQQHFVQAKHLYDIPQAEIGYTSGFGSVYALPVSPFNGQSTDGRLVIEAAMRHNVAVILTASGPARSSGSFADPAQLLIDYYADRFANTVTWTK